MCKRMTASSAPQATSLYTTRLITTTNILITSRSFIELYPVSYPLFSYYI
jgi:hypothetical protein